jgi:hypothetical protein
MKGGWRLFWLCAATFAVTLGLERMFVPDVVPVAFADDPQPLWMVETAFVLRALELMTGAVAILSLGLLVTVWAGRIGRRRAH